MRADKELYYCKFDRNKYYPSISKEAPMTVKELKDILAMLPDDMEIKLPEIPKNEKIISYEYEPEMTVYNAIFATDLDYDKFCAEVDDFLHTCKRLTVEDLKIILMRPKDISPIDKYYGWLDGEDVFKFWPKMYETDGNECVVSFYKAHLLVDPTLR